MRAAAFLFLVSACGDPPIHLALDIVTPASIAGKISDVEFQLLASDGSKVLTSATAVEQKGKLTEITLQRPSKTSSGILKATAEDSLGNTLAVGQTNIDLSLSVTAAEPATIFISSSQSDSFTAHPHPTSHHRFYATAVTVPGGDVWLIGGADETGAPLAVTESYDPSTLTFADGPALAAPCLQPTAVVASLNSSPYIIVAGGHTPKNDPCQGLQVIDPKGRLAGPLIPLPEPRRDATGYVLSDGRVALIGGAGTSDTATTSFILSLTSSLSIIVDQFNTNQNSLTFAAPARQAFGAIFGSDFYLAGDSLAIQKLNLTTGNFSIVGNFAVARPKAATFVAGAQALYTLGGGASDVERWSPSGNSATVTALQDNRDAPIALEVAGPTLVVAGGSDDNGDALSTVLFYDLSGPSPSLTSRTLVTSRAGHVMVRTVTNTLLVVGGSGAEPTAELFSLP